MTWIDPHGGRFTQGTAAWFAWAPGYVRNLLEKEPTVARMCGVSLSRVVSDCENFEAHHSEDWNAWCERELGVTSAHIAAIRARLPVARAEYEQECQQRRLENEWIGDLWLENEPTKLTNTRLRRTLKAEMGSKVRRVSVTLRTYNSTYIQVVASRDEDEEMTRSRVASVIRRFQRSTFQAQPWTWWWETNISPWISAAIYPPSIWDQYHPVKSEVAL